MTGRFKIRQRMPSGYAQAKGGYPTTREFQIVDEATVLGVFPTKLDAVRELVRLGARLHLEWQRTVIDGSALQYDFCAVDGDEKVGRIYRIKHPPSEGQWRWAMNASGPDIHHYRQTCSGVVATRDEAVRLVEHVYTLCLAPEE